MNESKHTPGPWDAQYHEPGTPSNHGLAGYSIQTVEVGIAYNVSNPANAALIAAAPEMYEALREAHELLKEYAAYGEAMREHGRGFSMDSCASSTGATPAETITFAAHALAKAEGR